jgi:hypothetical protein
MDPRHPLRIAYERKQWLRHDWRRWYPPGFEWPEEREAERKRAELAAREAEEAAWVEAEEAEAEARARLRWMLKDLKVELMLARLRRKYSPDQPRVPAGHRDGGQWARGGGAGRNDPRVVSDATPDPVRPGAQYAQGRGRGTIPVRIDGRTVEAEPGQAARLEATENMAQSALRRVRELDPAWAPTPSFQESVEGAIARAEAQTREAQARLDVLDRLGIDPPAARADAEVRPTAEILAPGGKLVGERESGAGGNIRTVPSDEFTQIRDQLMAGAVPVQTPRSYNGLWFDRPDGMRFGLRLSDDYGPTIDVMRSDKPPFEDGLKVHRR